MRICNFRSISSLHREATRSRLTHLVPPALIVANESRLPDGRVNLQQLIQGLPRIDRNFADQCALSAGRRAMAWAARPLRSIVSIPGRREPRSRNMATVAPLARHRRRASRLPELQPTAQLFMLRSFLAYDFARLLFRPQNDRIPGEGPGRKSLVHGDRPFPELTAAMVWSVLCRLAGGIA